MGIIFNGIWSTIILGVKINIGEMFDLIAEGITEILGENLLWHLLVIIWNMFVDFGTFLLNYIGGTMLFVFAIFMVVIFFGFYKLTNRRRSSVH